MVTKNIQCQEFTIPSTKQSLKSRGLASNTDIWLKQMSQRDSTLWGISPSTPYWIIDNKIYNLQQFQDKHPGGRSWLQLTRGQDITSLFKTHHLEQQKTNKILQKYYVGECPIKNENRFDFEDKYKEIRDRILKKYTVKQLQDCTQTNKVCYIITICWFLLVALSSYVRSYLMIVGCGALMMSFYGIGHLFIHKKDGHFLRHTFLLIGFSAKQQQIMHAISHHPYSNTLLDYQYAGLQPIMHFARCLPKGNYISWFLIQLIFLTVGPSNVLTKLLIVPIINKQSISYQHLIFPLQILYIYLFCGEFVLACKLWVVMIFVYGVVFGKMVLCPHRQIQLWSEGAPEIKDFVMHNIATTTDTNHSKLSPYISLIFYSGFNIHILHHLFPTIDHSKLYQCNKIFKQYCKEKGIKIMQSSSMFECNKKMFQLQVGRKQFDMKLFLEE